MNAPARSLAPGSGLGLWLGWVLVMVLAAGSVAAAVSSSMGEKLRAAIRTEAPAWAPEKTRMAA